jgi:hypothetical protein
MKKNKITRRSFLQWFSALSGASFVSFKGKKAFTAENNDILKTLAQ